MIGKQIKSAFQAAPLKIMLVAGWIYSKVNRNPLFFHFYFPAEYNSWLPGSNLLQLKHREAKCQIFKTTVKPRGISITKDS